jgi:c-di-GMP-binding flagellar brake protein YcgR
MENIPAMETVLYPGATVQIEYVNQNHCKAVMEALVRNIGKTTLVLEVANAKTVLGQLARRATIPLICKCDNEPRDMVFFTEYIKQTGNPPRLVVKRPSSYILGRGFLRYDVSLPFSYFLEGNEYSGGEIVNLSFGGLSGIIQPNDLLALGAEIVCQINLPANSDSEFIVGRLIRLEEQAANSKISVKFEDLTTDIADKIAKYFFSIEKNMINNGVQKSII